MKIEKLIYKVFYKGKKFALPITVSVNVLLREKVRVHSSRILNPKSFSMLIGEYTHTVDDKNRLSLPAKFRAEMGKKIVLTRGLDRCVAIFTKKEWEKIAAKLSESSMLQADSRSFNRFMFGGAVETEVDSIGRVLIPDFLKEWGSLGTKVVVIGVQNRVEIWNERAWEANKETIEKQADTLAEKLGQVGVL